MLKNYLLTAIRNIRKNFIYAVINVLGLALALAICITSFFNSKWNWDFNTIHENYEEIYKVNVTKMRETGEQEYGICPMPVGNRIISDIPQVDQVVNYTRHHSSVKRGKKIFNQRIGYTTENFGDIFTLEMLQGSYDALKDKNKILISETMAEKYFGQKEAVGKVLSVFNNKEQEYTFTVGGVFKEYPDNSSFYFDALTNLENNYNMWDVKRNDWHQWYYATFLYIKNPKDVDDVRKMLQDYIPEQNKAREDWKIKSFRVESLKTIHKTIRERWNTTFRYGLHPAQAKSPPIMALFILLIASFNFINTSIAFAGKRLKEISMRKVFGGSRKQLIIQFLTENFFLALISIIIGIILSTFIMDAYSKMWGYMDLTLNFSGNPELIWFLGGLLVLTTLLAGAYPAFYISSFKPVNIFRKKVKLNDRNAISKTLLGLQFVISVAALFSGILFTQNAEYQKTLDLGYNKDNILIVNLPNNEDYKPVEQIIRSTPQIDSYAGTRYHIGYGNYSGKFRYQEQEKNADVMNIGVNYLKTMGLKLKNGRYFQPEFEKADIANNSVIVNEKFVETFNLTNPLDKIVYMNDTTRMQIVGVVNDVYLYGPWSPVDPLAMRLAKKEKRSRFVLNIAEGHNRDVNQNLKEKWQEVVPNYPYNSMFQEDLLSEAKNVNKHIKEIFIFLAIVASLLSAVGLFALVSLRVISKTKEIGIRKVVGATIPIIMKVISKPYVMIISISIALGLTLGHLLSDVLMNSLWQHYVDPNSISYLLPLLLILLAAGITVTGKIYRAASQNPARSLKDE